MQAPAWSVQILKSTQPGIIMIVQSYGYQHDYPLTYAAARSKGWFIVENDTMGVYLKNHLSDNILKEFASVEGKNIWIINPERIQVIIFLLCLK